MTSGPSKEHVTCEKALERLVKFNPKVYKLLDSIEKLGCELPKNFFSCRSCDSEISGGFMIDDSNPKVPLPKIIICENKKLDIETFEHTVIHELVHAYDVCRAKLDFKNCVQHACTEIRASTLSGECGIIHDLARGHFKLHGGREDCVKRRAALSVEMNPSCTGKGAKAVEVAFKKCYDDTKPFDE